ncbi:MAG: N-acetylneuraminate synthase family protein, partial [Planctomycetes bacterium]|nr:N-acetylneuraminate synthase family protein [Planctomycetota bacterium]
DLNEINLKFIKRLQTYNVTVGYSGHEITPEVAIAAVTLGAKIIEKHITMDRNMDGPDHKASMLPSEFAYMVKAIRNVEISLGSEIKEISQGEMLNKEAVSKSIVAKVEIKKNEKITFDKLTLKSPGKGLPPHKLSTVLGKTAIRSIKIDDFITPDCFEEMCKDQFSFVDFAKFGLVGRFNDHPEIVKLGPKLIEYHLCYNDLFDGHLLNKCDCEVVFHAPEIVGDRLVDPASPDLPQRQYAIKVVKDVIRTLDQKRNLFVGNPKVIVHPGAASFDGYKDPDIYKKSFYESFEILLDYALEHNVMLLAENMAPLPWYFGGRWYTNYFVLPEQMIEFANDFNTKVCLDISHAKLSCNLFNYDFTKFVSLVKDYVEHIHISDAKGINGEGMQIDEGEIDFKSFFKLYSDYKGGWIPEIWRGHLNSYEGFKIALKRLSRHHVIAVEDEQIHNHSISYDDSSEPVGLGIDNSEEESFE